MKLKIEYLPVELLKEYAGNARIHTPHQVEQIQKSIAQFGFNVPLLIRPDNTLVAGHGRLIAAKSLGIDKVPCIRIEHLTDEQAKAFTLADNKIALNASWDFEKLSAELNDLVETNFDIGLIGFDESELDNLLAESCSILPEVQWSKDALAPVPTSQPLRQESDLQAPTVQEEASMRPEEEAKPSASHDKYSNFEMLMIHANKVELVEVLSSVRSMMGFPKLEDALMHIVRSYQQD